MIKVGIIIGAGLSFGLGAGLLSFGRVKEGEQVASSSSSPIPVANDEKSQAHTGTVGQSNRESHEVNLNKEAHQDSNEEGVMKAQKKAIACSSYANVDNPNSQFLKEQNDMITPVVTQKEECSGKNLLMEEGCAVDDQTMVEVFTESPGQLDANRDEGPKENLKANAPRGWKRVKRTEGRDQSCSKPLIEHETQESLKRNREAAINSVDEESVTEDLKRTQKKSKHNLSVQLHCSYVGTRALLAESYGGSRRRWPVVIVCERRRISVADCSWRSKFAWKLTVVQFAGIGWCAVAVVAGGGRRRGYEWFDDPQEKSVSVNRFIRHHVLSFLSRPWRHKGSTTRPNLNTTQQNFVTIVDRTLQGYVDQNLSVHKLHIHLSTSPISPPVMSLLNKWLSRMTTLNIKVLKLNFQSPPCNLSPAPPYYDSLEELHLRNCKLKSSVESMRFKHLRTLTLEKVQVDGGMIILGCPLLSRLVLNCCWTLNLRHVRLTSPGLKHFELCDYERVEGRSIEIDAQNIETVSIKGPWIWSQRQSALLFSRLTSLDLYSVILSSESFDLLSFGCPTLESLNLDNCSGFEEFHLASDSIKFLHICTTKILLKGVTICAPNIVHFEYTAHISQAPDTFSFTTTTSKEWSSKVFFSSHKNDPDLDINSWFLKLRRVLKALSGSWISLSLQMDVGLQDVPCSAVLCDEPPVVVLNFIFDTCKCRTAAWHMRFTNGLFRVCRPSHVYGCRVVSDSDGNYRFSEFELNILLANTKVRTEHCLWRHDLEQVFVESLDGQQWQLMQWKKLGKLRKRTQDRNIRLRLKWR
ncbi:Unknown protein, partial [Striga hermonthica]